MKKTKLQLLVVGSGGREHALAWKLAQSPRVGKIYAAPGNPGTVAFCENVPIAVNDVPGLNQFAVQQGINLVVVGPEVALEAGLVDSLQAAGIQAFGPTRLAARIETSKIFAKSLMQRHHIPTAAWASFDLFDPAWDYIQQAAFPLVLKASGLAAGKGVILPDTLAEARTALESMLVAGEFGTAGRQVVIEERLIGPEISL
ncbi:MAG TPA: phosphoribosylamine--glycine ligase, partial [Anaerolineaceae bacterium]|nr:phosphoribosylamine--glycine ligase [Anaerolineaceae bacterium]